MPINWSIVFKLATNLDKQLNSLSCGKQHCSNTNVQREREH